MSTKQDTTDDDGSKLPPEPELMQLWRRLIAARDELVDVIPQYESADHSDRVYLAQVAKLHGSHGRSELKLAESDRLAKRTAERLRARLKQIDSAIRIGRRDDSNERGLSVRQLHDLLAFDQGREASGRGRSTS